MAIAMAMAKAGLNDTANATNTEDMTNTLQRMMSSRNGLFESGLGYERGGKRSKG